jgi:glycosyltransferase involved in cell wall biosynthesis
MRIAIVVNTSWNIHNFRLNFVKALIAQGHEVHTIAPEDECTSLLVKEGCIHHSVTMDSRGANPIKDAALIFKLFFTYLRVKPAIVLHYTIKPNVYGTLAASLLGIPAINNVCGLGTVFLKDDLVSLFAMFLYKHSFRFAKKVFFQNQEDLQLFLDKKLVPCHIVDLVPGSGIDLQKFAPFAFKRNEKFTFLLISRLITDKGIMEYIQAIKKLSEQGLHARFQLLGAVDALHKRGIKKEIINEWIESGVVEYLGTTNDVRQFIQQADCVVLPSYREGTPRSLLEAASSSKPIIATNVPGCKQVVENNYNGLLCNLKDPDDLAEKMKRMARLSDSLLKKMGMNGRTKVETEYCETIVIDKYIQAIGMLQLSA